MQRSAHHDERCAPPAFKHSAKVAHRREERIGLLSGSLIYVHARNRRAGCKPARRHFYGQWAAPPLRRVHQQLAGQVRPPPTSPRKFCTTTRISTTHNERSSDT